MFDSMLPFKYLASRIGVGTRGTQFCRSKLHPQILLTIGAKPAPSKDTTFCTPGFQIFHRHCTWSLGFGNIQELKDFERLLKLTIHNLLCNTFLFSSINFLRFDIYQIVLKCFIVNWCETRSSISLGYLINMFVWWELQYWFSNFADWI